MVLKNDALFKTSSFLSIEKDLSKITDLLLENKNLKKLLYYNTKDALTKPDLNEEQSLQLITENIKYVPKITIDHDTKNYLILTLDNFYPNQNNPEFRNNIISFDIVCHFDSWQLNDFMIRPYRIAGEIDKMLNNKKLSGIGEVHFYGANVEVWNSEFAGLELSYFTIHGGEDKVFPLTKAEEDALFN